MTDKINTLETHLKSKMDQKLLTFESKLESKANTPEGKKNEKKSIDFGWFYPFIFLFVMLLGALGAFYYFYRNLLRKMHLP